MQSLARSQLGRSLSIVIIVSMLSAGCTPGFLSPAPGLPDYQAIALVPVPGGVYNTVGANLMIERADLSLDSILGEQIFGAVYNSATGVWHWSHDVRYNGSTFVDPTGAVYGIAGIANGAAVPGTHWVKVSSSVIKTKGGFAYSFDAQGRLDHVNWTSDPYPRIIYLWGSNVLELRRCNAESTPIESCPGIYTIQLGQSGPTAVVDAQSGLAGNNRLSLYTYDSLGRLKTAKTAFEVDQGLPGTTYEYETLGTLVTAQTNSEGERIEYDWLPGRLLASVTQIGEGNPLHSFTHEIFQTTYVVTHVNPAQGVTKYFMDPQRRLLFQQYVSTNEARMFTWPAGAFRPSQVNDIDGAITRYPQWVNDDPVRIIEKSGNQVVFTYQPNAVNFEEPRKRPIAQVTDSVGLVLTNTYDPQGRLETATNGEGETTTTGYQGLTLTSKTSAWGSTTLNTNYGIHGHWVDATTTEVPEVPVKRKFDVVGNALLPAAGLQRGGILERAYNENRELASLSVAPSDDFGGVGPTDTVSIERRSDGLPLAYRRPSGGDHEFEYDSLGRQHLARERVSGVWQTTATTYNALGLLISIDKPNGMRESFEYDVYGRLIARRAFRNSVLQGEVTSIWSRGNISESYDSLRDQTTRFFYDTAGRVKLLTYSEIGESIAYDYDLRSRVTRERYTIPSAPSAIVLELQRDWDLADRQTRLSRINGSPQGELLAEWSYEGGRRASVTYGNGLVREWVYDEETLAHVGFEMRNAQQQLVESTTITREVKAGPTRLEFVNETTSPLAHTKEEYWLNRPGNLALAEGRIGARVFRWRGWEGDVLQEERFFAWDDLGNPASDSDGDTFTYNTERNRLLAASGSAPHSYTYDEAGFAKTRDGMQLAWSATGLLTRVGPVQSPLVSIAWDMADRPMSITAAGVTREFPMFGGMVEYNASSGELGWLHLEEVSIPFVGSERVYRHKDFRGNTALVSDETGAIVVHKRYHPFGVDAGFLAASYTERYPAGFAGGLELMGTGLVWLGARILDSDVGRFLSPDPVHQEFQQYTYALGNPVWFRDSDGRDFEADAEFSANAAIAAGSVITFVGILSGNAAAVELGAALIAYGALVHLLLAISQRFSAGLAEVEGSQSSLGALGALTALPAPFAFDRGSLEAPADVGGGLSGVGGGPCSPIAGSWTEPRTWILLLLFMQLVTSLAVGRRRRPTDQSLSTES